MRGNATNFGLEWKILFRSSEYRMHFFRCSSYNGNGRSILLDGKWMKELKRLRGDTPTNYKSIFSSTMNNEIIQTSQTHYCLHTKCAPT